jgi:selenocysteine lyase/cysteine desulfurase
VEELAALCREKGVPFIIDAAQSAGMLPVSLEALGAGFIAMPGHKGLLGPQGTGLLLCRDSARPLVYGGTGSESRLQEMPDFLPDRLEAGTLNVPGIAGLEAGIRFVAQTGVEQIGQREQKQAKLAINGLRKLGFQVFSGPHQGGTVSFVSGGDCEEFAQRLGMQGIAVRAGLHCAPLAHESAGTLETGTVRISFGWDAADYQTGALMETFAKGKERKY